MKTLRPYQQKDLASIERLISSGVGTIMYALPTGGGKTVTANHLLHNAARTASRKRRRIGYLRICERSRTAPFDALVVSVA
jgi:superfamily II DNA or RNA helicase